MNTNLTSFKQLFTERSKLTAESLTSMLKYQRDSFKATAFAMYECVTEKRKTLGARFVIPLGGTCKHKEPPAEVTLGHGDKQATAKVIAILPADELA